MRDFGLSNILYMLNGLLRYIHPDFTDHDLDCVEKLVDRVGSEGFHILQKSPRSENMARPLATGSPYRLVNKKIIARPPTMLTVDQSR